ncbi:hypothetical protein ILUMI_20011 [Ignelater luminosus]|uniref:Reverse transcriptase domain-containing protein n=1 Tax=Ignelater luminosus TaxID=2038154 RepID=A0A8K0CI68_IGNLU|nr:hypothetical protein ILUMI_20011 [Ignelater luminosus]
MMAKFKAKYSGVSSPLIGSPWGGDGFKRSQKEQEKRSNQNCKKYSEVLRTEGNEGKQKVKAVFHFLNNYTVHLIRPLQKGCGGKSKKLKVEYEMLKEEATKDTVKKNVRENTKKTIKLNKQERGVTKKYADDTVMIATTRKDLQMMLKRINTYSEESGLKINFKKINYMVFCKKPKLIQGQLMLDNTAIETITNKIYNLDESGLSTVQNPGKIVAPKGKKQVGAVTSGERGVTVTIICATHMLLCAPPGVSGVANPSDWTNDAVFIKYLDHLIHYVRPIAEDPVLLV